MTEFRLKLAYTLPCEQIPPVVAHRFARVLARWDGSEAKFSGEAYVGSARWTPWPRVCVGLASTRSVRGWAYLAADWWLAWRNPAVRASPYPHQYKNSGVVEASGFEP